MNRNPKLILEYDEKLQTLVKNYLPKWTELRARTLQFSKRDENTYLSDSVMLVGNPSLECFVGSEVPAKLRVEYFPLCLEVSDTAMHHPSDWMVIAQKGGTSELERKVRWLFERPEMRLLASEEECADGIGPDAQQYLLKFYGGLEITDPQGRGSLRITASDQPDFIVTLRFTF